ncbi:MAG: hypothetical protein JEZ14_15435 [Marinilabiliaceae bacterium]|nr:hypothetical protein [Marinilabiliaceae bacterium]
MDDFGDILYVLAMLAALVFSAIRKSKQSKKRPAAPMENQADPFDPMEEEEPIIQDLRDLFKPKPVRPQPVSDVSEIKTGQAKSFQKAYIHKTPRRSTKPLDAIEPEEAYDSNDFFEDGIDLRQAVIYSEILKRPYQ